MCPFVLTCVLKMTLCRPGPGRTVTCGGRLGVLRTPTTSPVTKVTVQDWPAGSALSAALPGVAVSWPGALGGRALAALAASAGAAASTTPALSSAVLRSAAARKAVLCAAVPAVPHEAFS